MKQKRERRRDAGSKRRQGMTLITASMRSSFDDPGILHVLDQSQCPIKRLYSLVITALIIESQAFGAPDFS